MRLSDGRGLTYPLWVPVAVDTEWVVRHDLDDRSWAECLGAVAGLARNQLDVRRMPWRLHLFSPVLGIPGVAGPGTVAVLQVPHALADGTRASAMAAWLFGRPNPVPRVPAPRPGFLPFRAVEAARAHRRLSRDTRAGLLAPGPGPCNAPMPARTAPARSAPWCAAARSCPAPPSPSACWRRCRRPCPVCSGSPPMRWAPRCRWASPVCDRRITTSETSASACSRSSIEISAPSGSRATWPMDAAGSRIRLQVLPTGLSPRCPRPCCAGAYPSSTPTSGRPKWPATPWCPASTGRRRPELRRRAGGVDRRISGIVTGGGPDPRGAWHRGHHCDQRARGGVRRSRHRRVRAATRRGAVTYCASPDLAASSRVRPAATINSSCSSNQTVW